MARKYKRINLGKGGIQTYHAILNLLYILEDIAGIDSDNVWRVIYKNRDNLSVTNYSGNIKQAKNV